MYESLQQKILTDIYKNAIIKMVTCRIVFLCAKLEGWQVGLQYRCGNTYV